MATDKQQDTIIERSVQNVQEKIDYRFARKAEELGNSGMIDEGLTLLRKGIEMFPDYPIAYQILGDLYMKKEENISATFAYLEALKRDPNNALTLMKLGDLFVKENQPEQAKNYYLDALRLDPNSEVLTARLGINADDDEALSAIFLTETAADLYRQQGHTEKARGILLRLLKRSPDNKHLQEKLKDLS